MTHVCLFWFAERSSAGMRLAGVVAPRSLRLMGRLRTFHWWDLERLKTWLKTLDIYGILWEFHGYIYIYDFIGL